MLHTKGKWINLGYRIDVDIADGLSGICEMSDWMGKEEMEANAKLISAAPELLEALQEVLAFEKRGADKGEPRIGNGILSIIHKAIKNATT